MLTTPTILMSHGTQQVNVSQVPSAHSGDAAISFATSFNEGSTLIDEAKTQVSDANRAKGGIEDKEAVPEKRTTIIPVLSDPATKVDTKTISKIENGAMDASSPRAGVKGTGSSSARGIAAIIEELHRHSEQTSMSKSGQAQLQRDQISSDGGKDIDQKSTPTLSAQTKTPDVTDETVVPQSGEDSSTIPDTAAKQPAQKLTQVLNPVGSRDTVPSKTVIEDHDKATKPEKTAKTEKKEDKPVGPVGSMVGAESAKAIQAPLVLLPPPKSTDAVNTATDDDALSSVASGTSRQDGAAAAAADGKVDGKSTVKGKGDGDSTKVADTLSPKYPADGKPDTDTEKVLAPAVKAADHDNAEQKVAPSTGASAAETTHAEPGTSTVALAGVPAGAATHSVMASRQTAEINPHAASGQAGPGAGDPSGSMDAPHKTLMATPTTLEVGIANGTHGWLRIRAEMSGGAVNASLSPATSSGQEMLHRELPSLTAYLRSESVAVNAVVVQPAAVVVADARGLSGGMNGSGSGQPQQGSNQGGENRQTTADTLLSRMDKAVPFSGASNAGVDEVLPSAQYAGGGSWLSVRA